MYLITMRYFSGYADTAEAERLINGFHDGNAWFVDNRIPALCAYTEDDPVGWQLWPEWLDVVRKSSHIAAALFRHGGHCACFEGWRLTSWLDRLVLQWIDAVELEATAGDSATREGV